MIPLDARQGPPQSGPAVVALGGGHGLAVSLRALRRSTDRLTAVVGVADDGGSSGRLRRELAVLPPGDLRMALAALCGDDGWGRTWSRVIQHRLGGEGELAGHSVGNLLITALWEETGDIVEGLDWVGSLLGAHGRVLPVAEEPLDIVAQVRGLDPSAPNDVEVVFGQVAVATTPGQVIDIRLEPPNPIACRPALDAIVEADAIVVGPGSWFTSVLPHFLIDGVVDAMNRSSARRILVLNRAPQPGETSGFEPHTHLEVLHRLFPQLRFDVVLADPSSVPDLAPLREAAANIGGDVVLRPIGREDDPTRHDSDLLASAFGSLLRTLDGHERIAPWQ